MTRRNLITAAAGTALLASASPALSETVVTVFPWGRRYCSQGPYGPREIYVLGEPPAAPRRTALILYQQGDKSLTTAGVPSYEFAQALLGGVPAQAAQWTICSVGVPCHQLPDIYRKADGSYDEPLYLDGWADRYTRGRRLWDLDFIQRARVGLTLLAQAGYTDQRKIALVGVSRGGICAFHLAAADARIKWIIGLNPVTRLLDLKPWFANHPAPEACQQEDVALLAPSLVSKSILWTVNGFDSTVSTRAVLETYQTCFDAGGPTDTKVPDHTLVLPGNPGHRTPWRTYPRLIDWMNLRADAVLDPPM